MTRHPAPPAFGTAFRLTLVTADPALARDAAACGVDEIGVDLETIGKAARQPPGARHSGHDLKDLAAVAAAIGPKRAFVRVNPIHDGSAAEIEGVLEAGAGTVMLPYFHTRAEAETFVRRLDGRARCVLLVETPAALAAIGDILSIGGVDEIMLGLNDLRLSLGLASHFEVLTSPLAEAAGDEARRAGVAFAAGGVTTPTTPDLPASPDLVLAQYPRIGATGAWLSRAFVSRLRDRDDLAKGVDEIRARLSHWASQPRTALDAARDRLADAVQANAAPPRDLCRLADATA